ncbi:MAG: glycosyltransferase [Armatimonadetes bacterium]|nr:glycosyltransferase [Armatimonadota bacterium]NIM24678.1 glycosyltransferase [Armatimonadota bacterium]NIM68557.1 glycosyltransferase [Armatimonadota bacterium]NIM76937.1 glycosyltransferase [Armatimonadota bacterium]NIN06751.1 glycosyltransferase [Armatimonadota bacterium]
MKQVISAIIPALNEADNLAVLLPALHRQLKKISADSYEIIVVEGSSTDATEQVAHDLGAMVVDQVEPGYGGALLAGFAAAEGEWIVTLDADLSHEPGFVNDLWSAKDTADVIIASRYVKGGRADMPLFRLVLSRILNSFFTRGLSLPLKDISSGFRLYRASVVKGMNLVSRDFDVLEEIVVRARVDGNNLKEIPFTYKPRVTGQSHAKLIRFGIAYLKTFWRMWKLRHGKGG